MIIKLAQQQNNMSNIPRPLFRSFSRLGRHWLKRSRPNHIEASFKNSSFEFTVASYNVLADHLLQEHPHLYYGQNGDEPWVYDWNYRKCNLMEEFKCSNPDILCLQEVQEDHYYDWFNPRLNEEGYTGIYKKRTGDKHDGCATFFKRDRFALESYQLIDFRRSNCSMLDRDNVAILLFLQPLSKKKLKNRSPICVSNTHLLFNKKRGDIKLAQLAYLFAEIDRLAGNKSTTSCEYPPIIMCGDFNSTPFSPLYNLVTTGKLRYSGLSRTLVSGQLKEKPRDSWSGNFGNSIFPQDLGLSNYCKWKSIGNESNRGTSNEVQVFNVETNEYENCFASSENDLPGYLKHNLALQSCYQHYSVDGTPEVTTCHDRAAVTVDYIFYSKPSGLYEREQLWLSGVLDLLGEHEVKDLGSLPNKYISSDHLLLMASFVMH